jgi:hypothetical protein
MRGAFTMANARKSTAEPVAEVELAKLNREELAELTSFDDAVRFLAQNGYAVESAGDLLGDGFEQVDKKDLINRTFIIVDAQVSMSKEYIGADFSIVRLIDQGGKKMFFTDGSTGINEQIKMLIARRKGGAAGVICVKGLNVSTYPIDGDGKPCSEEDKQGMGATYYLDVSK